MARRKHSEGHENHERWLITYSDLITLLMIFFVVMYSMSKVDNNKFRAMADALNITLGGTPGKISIAETASGDSLIEMGGPQSNTQSTSADPKNSNQMQQNSYGNASVENMTIQSIKAKLDQFAKTNGIESKLISNTEERGLVVSIQDTLLFQPGSAEIASNANDILHKISSILAASQNYIKVEGHTCTLPIHTSQYQSNWELSVIRATNVVHILSNNGQIDPKRLSATGYGEFRPIASNDTEDGRIKNRRVDLVILKAKYDAVEPGLAVAH